MRLLKLTLFRVESVSCNLQHLPAAVCERFRRQFPSCNIIGSVKNTAAFAICLIPQRYAAVTPMGSCAAHGLPECGMQVGSCQCRARPSRVCVKRYRNGAISHYDTPAFCILGLRHTSLLLIIQRKAFCMPNPLVQYPRYRSISGCHQYYCSENAPYLPG